MRTALLPGVIFAVMLAAAPAFAAQTVWKWVDDQGVTHYSDRPVPGATKIELNVGTVKSSAGALSPSSTSTRTQPAAPQSPAYRNFEIWKPANDQVYINTGGQVTVNIRVDPSLRSGDSLLLYLDGRLVQGYPENATSYDLTQVPRGTHTVVAVINDRQGTRVRDTQPVTFHVRQESIAQPPVGPALRPPPKPRPRTSAAVNKLRTRQPTYADLHGAPAARIDPRTNAPVPVKGRGSDRDQESDRNSNQRSEQGPGRGDPQQDGTA